MLLFIRPMCFLTSGLDKLIKASPDLYTLKKRASYLIAFKQYFISKVKKQEFRRVELNATFLDNAFLDVIYDVQRNYFGLVIDLLKKILRMLLSQF